MGTAGPTAPLGLPSSSASSSETRTTVTSPSFEWMTYPAAASLSFPERLTSSARYSAIRPGVRNVSPSSSSSSSPSGSASTSTLLMNGRPPPRPNAIRRGCGKSGLDPGLETLSPSVEAVSLLLNCSVISGCRGGPHCISESVISPTDTRRGVGCSPDGPASMESSRKPVLCSVADSTATL